MGSEATVVLFPLKLAAVVGLPIDAGSDGWFSGDSSVRVAISSVAVAACR